MGTRQDGQSPSRINVVQWFRAMNRKERLSVIISVGIILTMIITSIAVLKGVDKEKYTEFYVLNAEGKAYDYPGQVTAGNETSIILGVANHEGRTIKYTIEAWLVNYTLINMTLNVTQMYYVDSFEIELENVDYELDGPWVPQYERPTVLNLTVPGNYTLFLMMFMDDVLPDPDLMPFYQEYDYSKTNATRRMLMCVNHEIAILQLGIEVIGTMVPMENQAIVINE